MTALKKRAFALENKFARDQELMFRAQARRNALIGLWAAAAMDKPDVAAYASELVAVGVEQPDAVIEKLRTDFDTANVIPSDDLDLRMISMLKEVADDMYRN